MVVRAAGIICFVYEGRAFKGGLFGTVAYPAEGLQLNEGYLTGNAIHQEGLGFSV